ncbi:Predicted PurR-regulated permease PerM [Sphingomonas sp. OV641]|uniref:AI-2E family transporter n=1 Tax=unclassified Sphingomonas TaxID=196159 RepID=UPI00082D4959|nr:MULTISPECIES: AI-2E family transporter [unclassified Sphingomonas]SEJ14287.1 Predicted PurR-regulated permease PerM [Sphingomonas sp. OV641]
MNRLSPDQDDARYIRRLFLTLGVIALAATLYFTGDLLILAFGSILGAIVIHALAEIFEDRLRLSPKPALGAGIFTVLALIIFLGWLFGVEFRTQVNVLVTRLPGILAEIGAQLSTSPVGAKVVDAVRSAFAGSRVAQDIGGLAEGAGQFVLNALLVLVGAIFFAVDPKVYERGFLLLMPPSKRAVLEDALLDTASTLRLWLRAQLIQMTSMGVLVGLGLWLVGVPSAPALGLLTGLSEFIPYVGPLAAMVPALGLAATQSLHHVLLTVAVFAVVRVVQTNFITPFVTSRVVAIPPAVTLFAILAIGAVFGLFGLFFSAAILVVIYTLIRSLYLRDTLGEDIPRTRHRTLFDAAGSPRDLPGTMD